MPGTTGAPHRRRLLLVHAHPDDETLTTGVTMAHHVDRGDDVHVLTCTLGEEGEVIPPDLAHLAADREDRLGPWRREELRAAMAELGVTHEVLGEDGYAAVPSRYRDSGMAGTASADHPRAFVRADPEEVVARVAAVIARVRPDVIITYDRNGGYGHPDHIRAHQVTCAAVAGLGSDAPPLYAVLTPISWAREDRAWLSEHIDPATGWTVPAPEDPFPPSVRPDDEITRVVIDPGVVPRQEAALRRHRTQVIVGPGCYALSNRIAARLPGREAFAPLDSRTGVTMGEPAGTGPAGRPGRWVAGLVPEPAR